MKNLHRISLVASMLIAVIMPFILRSSKVYNIDPDMWKAMGLDPNASSAVVPDLEARFNSLDLDGDGFIDPVEVQAVNNGTAASYKSGSSSASSQSATSTPKDTGKGEKAQKNVKITVYFTDLYGHVIGSSQITSGTSIGEKQFATDIPDCNGKKFDSWDYDNRELFHDTIVRANYK